MAFILPHPLEALKSGIIGMCIHGIDCYSEGLLYQSNDGIDKPNRHHVEKRHIEGILPFITMVLQVIGFVLTATRGNPVSFLLGGLMSLLLIILGLIGTLLLIVFCVTSHNDLELNIG